MASANTLNLSPQSDMTSVVLVFTAEYVEGGLSYQLLIVEHSVVSAMRRAINELLLYVLRCLVLNITTGVCLIMLH